MGFLETSARVALADLEGAEKAHVMRVAIEAGKAMNDQENQTQSEHSKLVTMLQTKSCQKKLNGGKRGTSGSPGCRFQLPLEKSVIAEVKEGMRAFPKQQDKAAKSIGMSTHSYAFIRKLIMLSERTVLAQADRQVLNKSLGLVESDRKVANAQRLAREVIERCWITKKDEPYTVSRRKRRFDQTIMSIRESCASTADMTLPHDLTKENVAEAIGTLAESQEMISRLLQKLVGGTVTER